MTIYKIAIVEGQALIREGLRSILTNIPGFSVYTARNLPALFQQTWGNPPQIIIIDNPSQTGDVEAFKALKQKWPQVKVLIFTALDDNQSIANAFEAEADGYQLSNAEPLELIYAVEQVLAGNSYISPSLLPKLIQKFSLYYKALDNNFALALSERERQMLKLIACGIKNKAIADSLFLSIRTVESHRFNLMKKLNAHNAADLATIAIRMGMI